MFEGNVAYLSIRRISEELLYSIELSNLETFYKKETEDFYKVIELIPVKRTKHNKYDKPRFIKDILRLK